MATLPSPPTPPEVPAKPLTPAQIKALHDKEEAARIAAEKKTADAEAARLKAETDAKIEAARLLSARKAHIRLIYHSAVAAGHAGDKDADTFASTVISTEDTLLNSSDQSLRELSINGYQGAIGLTHPQAFPAYQKPLLPLVRPFLFDEEDEHLSDFSISILLTYFNFGIPILNDPIVCCALLLRMALVTIFIQKAAKRYEPSTDDVAFNEAEKIRLEAEKKAADALAISIARNRGVVTSPM